MMILLRDAWKESCGSVTSSTVYVGSNPRFRVKNPGAHRLTYDTPNGNIRVIL
jgi:hypothetical protein